MKLFYVAIFLIVSSMPIGFVGLFTAWDKTPPQLRLVQLDQIIHTGAMTYLGMIVLSVLVFLVWLCLPGDRAKVVYR